MDGPTSPLCASRFAWARLVAVPAVLGPVVPDAVPRSASSPCPCEPSGRRRCARPRRSHGRGGEPVPAALLVRTAAPGAPPGSRDRHLTREGGRRDRRATCEIVPPADVLAGRPTISRTRPERGGMGRGPGPGPRRLPGRPRAGTGRTQAGRDRGRLAQFHVSPTRSRSWDRYGAGFGLRNASPARHSPPRLTPCEPSATKSVFARFS